MPQIVCIDPGASGGIAWRDHAGEIHSIGMPEDAKESDVLKIIRDIGICNSSFVIEQVFGYIGGMAPGPVMFTFGKGYGFLIGVVMAYERPLELVLPKRWQKDLGIGVKKDSPKDWKARLKNKASQLYPDQKVTLKTADALLILNWKLKNL